jgi:ABC-2 type transport system ATP-binding protein
VTTFAELRGVTVKRRHRTILDEVDLDLDATGLTLLGGENGAGKSTLLHAMCGLVVPTSGTIRIAGHDLAHAAGRRAMRGTIVLLPQAPTCPGTFTVDDLLVYGAWLQQVPVGQRSDRRRRCLEQVQLTGFGARRVHRLSGGEQRRAFIASALMGDARLLLLDEPTVGLDAAQRVTVRSILRTAATDRALLVSSHIAEDFEHLADRIVLIDGGHVVFDGSRGAFDARAAPATPHMSRAEASFAAILDESTER